MRKGNFLLNKVLIILFQDVSRPQPSTFLGLSLMTMTMQVMSLLFEARITGAEILTKNLPTKAIDIEEMMS